MLNTTMIDDVLNKFLADNDFECTAEMGTDFAFYWMNDLITYSLVVSERMDNLFLNFAKENGLKVDCGIFILSFFHELGHYETIDELTDAEERCCERVKAKLDSNKNADCYKYFSLVDEWLATSWAIDYINEHIEQVKELAINVQEAINAFTNTYSLED